jgi:hypothetical protein
MPEFQLAPPLISKDFVNLVVDLFNELYNTTSFKCFGKNGHKQKGIDILSSQKNIVIQCKLKDLTRRPILVKKELFNDIEETINFILEKRPKIKFNTLYIASTFSEHPDFDEYCETIKEEKKLEFDIIFWGWETIQGKIIALPKTLSSHFSNFIIPQFSEESRLLSKLDMKRKIEKDFASWLNYSFENRKLNSKMIIHSIDDTKYPEHELNKEGKYQWFGAEIRNRSHKGLEFTTAIEEIYVDKEFCWTDRIPQKPQDLLKVKVARVSVIAYEDIVDYDLRGDEHYIQPHFFCKFRHGGTPFFQEYFLTLDNQDVPYFFDETTRRLGNPVI